MTYLLDNNVLSEIWKPKPEAAVLAFLNAAEWFVPVPVIAEIQEGAEASPSAARRVELVAVSRGASRLAKPDFPSRKNGLH